MSDFQVATESLMLGSSLIQTSGASRQSASVGSAGGAAQTPVAGAWSEFVDRADQAVAGPDQVVGDLSRALQTAANAYATADLAAAASLQVGR